MRTRTKTTNVIFSGWPSWRYGPDGQAKVCNGPEEVPYGWTPKQGEIFEPPKSYQLDREDLLNQLIERRINIDQRWGTAHLKKVLDDSSTHR